MRLLLLVLVVLLPLQLKQGLPPCKACQASSSLLLDGSRGYQRDQGVYQSLCYEAQACLDQTGQG